MLLNRLFLCRASTWKKPTHDTACELAASNIRFGLGVTAEVGLDLKEMKAKNVVVFTDNNIKHLEPVRVVMESLERAGVRATLFSDVRIEPNDKSFKKAIAFMTEGTKTPFDAIVAVGGGSVIDTAKVANLYFCHPPENFYDYVNAPLGKGLPVPGPVLPLIAIPTTAGTGSETTGVAVFDDTAKKGKTGIAHRRLKPTLGIVDPLNTATMPSEVAKFSGLDVLCHSVESYTALPFTERAYPDSPLLRPSYQGSNPISDVWSLHALRITVKYLERAVKNPCDLEARTQMILASAFAGIGFGNAGCHLCHGLSYAVASQVKSYVPKGYGSDHPMVPHGHSVIVNAPAVFRFTGQACPDRHLECAEILGAKPKKTVKPTEAGFYLADQISELMVRLNIPIGLEALGYTKSDIPSLTQATLPQHRVTKLSPRPVGEAEIHALFEDAMKS